MAKMKLCAPCYKRHISLEMFLPLRTMNHVIEVLTGKKPENKFEFTSIHDECENCPTELRRLGHDPCIERLEFDYEIEDFGSDKRKHGYSFIRLFSFLAGFDGVSDSGNYLEFWDVRISSRLVTVTEGDFSCDY